MFPEMIMETTSTLPKMVVTMDGVVARPTVAFDMAANMYIPTPADATIPSAELS